MRSIAVELLKLRRKRLIVLAFAAVLFTIVTAYLPSISTGRFNWQELFSASMFMLSEVLYLLFGYITGIVFAGEFENNTIESLLSTPISISEVVFGKLAAITAMAIVTLFAAFALTLSAGLVFRFGQIPAGLLGNYLKALAIVVITHLCYIPIYILTSVSTKKTIYPSVIGMAMVAVMMIFAVAEYAGYIPACFPLLIQVEILGNSAYTRDFLHALELATVKPQVVVPLLAVIAILLAPFITRFLRRY